jgi:hypothetical protein
MRNDQILKLRTWFEPLKVATISATLGRWARHVGRHGPLARFGPFKGRTLPVVGVDSTAPLSHA